MLFSLNNIKVIPFLIGNLLIWRNLHLRSFISNLIIMFHTLKEGGSILDQSTVLPYFTYQNVIAKEIFDDSIVFAGPEISLEEPILQPMFQDKQPSQPL